MPPSDSAVRDAPSSKRGRDDDSSPPAAADGVVNLHEELMCGICHGLVVNATQTPCCGGLWCRGCIEKVNQRLCPACRASFTKRKLFTDARSERLSASLKRSCKHEARGCTFKGNRSDVNDHEPTCPHLTVAEVRKEMEGQMATITANMQDRIDGLTKELGTELRNEQAEVRKLKRQLLSAQLVNSTHSITTSELQKENGLLSGLLNCDHVFAFRLHPGKSHTERCDVQSCCWFQIDVVVKCNDDKRSRCFFIAHGCLRRMSLNANISTRGQSLFDMLQTRLPSRSRRMSSRFQRIKIGQVEDLSAFPHG